MALGLYYLNISEGEKSQMGSETVLAKYHVVWVSVYVCVCCATTMFIWMYMHIHVGGVVCECSVITMFMWMCMHICVYVCVVCVVS